MSNALQRALSKLNRMPAFLRPWLRDFAIGRTIPFVRTAGLKIETLNATGCTIQLHNRAKVQNHIRGVHAAATALLAESATGLAFGWHLPDDKLPLLKQMKIDYVKRAQGGLRAEASLTPEQITSMQASDKGSVLVAVKVIDDAGNEPVICAMEWACVPKQKK